MARKEPAKQKPADKLNAIGIETICDQIADAMYYSKIAEQAGVARGSLIKWLEDNHSDLYARAREARADKIAEDILDIADDSSSDSYVDDNGKVRTDTEVVARSRLRVDARKWLASKMLPKKYGDKLELAGNQDSPLTVQILRLSDVKE